MMSSSPFIANSRRRCNVFVLMRQLWAINDIKRNVTQSFLFKTNILTYLIFNAVFILFYVIRFVSSTSSDLRSLNDSNRYETRTYLSNGPHLCCFLLLISVVSCASWLFIAFWPFDQSMCHDTSSSIFRFSFFSNTLTCSNINT